MTVAWYFTIIGLALLGGAAHAYWDMTLSRIMTRCAVDAVKRNAEELFAWMNSPEGRAANARAFEAIRERYRR